MEVTPDPLSINSSSSSIISTANSDDKVLLPDVVFPASVSTGACVNHENEVEVTPSMSSENNLLGTPENVTPRYARSSTYHIISKIWVWIVTMFITYVVCLTLFPSVTALVESTNNGKVIKLELNMNLISIYFLSFEFNVSHLISSIYIKSRVIFGTTNTLLL